MQQINLEKMWKRSCESRKGFTLLILNNYMDSIIKIVKSLEDLGLLIHGVSETTKHEIKKQEDGLLY